MTPLYKFFFAVLITTTLAEPASGKDDVTGVYTRTDDIPDTARFTPGETAHSYVGIYKKGSKLMGHIRIKSLKEGSACSMSKAATRVTDETITFTRSFFGDTCTLSYKRDGDMLTFDNADNCSDFCGRIDDFGFVSEPLIKSCDTVNTESFRDLAGFQTVKDVDLICGTP